MSNYKYNPIPPRVWSRVQNPCTYTVPGSDYTEAFIPLTGQTVSQAQADYETKQIYKGNILQYKGNSARLTKSQRYSQLARMAGPNRTKVFATQSETYSNPNTTGLLRVGFQTYPYPNDIVGAPNNISGPFQYNIQNPNDCSGNSVQDGGTLVCGTFANPCTGEIIKQGVYSATICNPSSASDVPGFSTLCWNNKVQTWFPKPRYVMNNSTDKWPQGYKGFVSAIEPYAPYLMINIEDNCSLTLSWKQLNNKCTPISSFNIYQNGVLFKNVPYTTISINISIDTCLNYFFYVTSLSTTIESSPSNIVNYAPETPYPPSLTLNIEDNCSITLSWIINNNNNCTPITNFNIYQNGQLYQNVPYTITNINISIDPCFSYSFYVTSLSCTTIESYPSNIVNYNPDISPPIITSAIAGENACQISWNPPTPAYCSNTCIIGYNGQVNDFSIYTNITSPYIFTGLTNGNEYVFNIYTVYSVNGTTVISAPASVALTPNIYFTSSISGTSGTAGIYKYVYFNGGISGTIKFNLSQSYVPYVRLVCVSGGGGGGSGGSVDGQHYSGRGGGGGGCGVFEINPPIIGSNYSFTVGSGGPGGPGGNGIDGNNGTAGGLSRLISPSAITLIQCIGATGGSAGPDDNVGIGGKRTIPPPDANAGGNGGDTQENGTNSATINSQLSVPAALPLPFSVSYGGGGGGSDQGENGGSAGNYGNKGLAYAAIDFNGQDATAPGSGGGGAGNNNAGSGTIYYNGGDGAPGLIGFWWQPLF